MLLPMVQEKMPILKIIVLEGKLVQHRCTIQRHIYVKGIAIWYPLWVKNKDLCAKNITLFVFGGLCLKKNTVKAFFW